MDRICRTRPLPDGSTVEICPSTTAAESETRYELALVSPSERRDRLDIRPVGEAAMQAGADDIEAPEADRRLTVNIPDDRSIERLVISGPGWRRVMFLPSESLLAQFRRAIDGDAAAVSTVLSTVDTPVQVPAIYGGFLKIQSLIDLVDAVTDLNQHASSLIHSYRYPIMRGALVSPAGLSVSTRSELETLVDGFDAMPGIGEVNLIDVLGETMATINKTVSDTEDLLTSLGYDLSELETRADGRFFAYHLAQLVLSDGYRAAEGIAMRRRYNIQGNYKRRKMEAENANYAQRGAKWRNLICTAARDSLEEFKCVLANALYWTAEVTRTDSQVDEFVHRSAITLTKQIPLVPLRAMAEFDFHTAAGHRLRGRHQYELAQSRFDRAESVASEYEFLPAWKPRYYRGIVYSRQLDKGGNHTEAAEVLDATIADLRADSIDSNKVIESIRHLRAQKLEIQATGADDDDATRELLEEAQDYFDTIGFDRSADRIRRKLQNLPEPASSDSETAPSSPNPSGEPAQSQTEPETQPQADSGTKTVDDGTDVVRTSATSEAAPRGVPTGVDPLAPTDPDAVGSADLMAGPDVQERSLPDEDGSVHSDDDPYAY